MFHVSVNSWSCYKSTSLQLWSATHSDMWDIERLCILSSIVYCICLCWLDHLPKHFCRSFWRMLKDSECLIDILSLYELCHKLHLLVRCERIFQCCCKTFIHDNNNYWTNKTVELERMSSKWSCQYKLSESMTNHFFIDIETNKAFTVVDSQCETNHLRSDLACSVPHLNYLFISACCHLFYLFSKLLVDVKAFF